MLVRYTPQGQAALVEAALAALDAGAHRLGTGPLLLGIAEVPGAAPALERRGVTADQIRAELPPAAGSHADDRSLLATLGIDLDEVRRRTGVRRDDPAGWRMARSRVRPLRLTLSGPAGTVVLTGQGRKVIEVAAWAAGRRAPITGDHVLWGLLADGHNASARILHRLGVDVRAIWRDLSGRRAA